MTWAVEFLTAYWPYLAVNVPALAAVAYINRDALPAIPKLSWPFSGNAEKKAVKKADARVARIRSLVDEILSEACHLEPARRDQINKYVDSIKSEVK